MSEELEQSTNYGNEMSEQDKHVVAKGVFDYVVRNHKVKILVASGIFVLLNGAMSFFGNIFAVAAQGVTFTGALRHVVSMFPGIETDVRALRLNDSVRDKEIKEIRHTGDSAQRHNDSVTYVLSVRQDGLRDNLRNVNTNVQSLRANFQKK